WGGAVVRGTAMVAVTAGVTYGGVRAIDKLRESFAPHAAVDVLEPPTPNVDVSPARPPAPSPVTPSTPRRSSAPRRSTSPPRESGGAVARSPARRPAVFDVRAQRDS